MELDDELGMRIENELRIHLTKEKAMAGKFINPKVLLKIVNKYLFHLKVGTSKDESGEYIPKDRELENKFNFDYLKKNSNNVIMNFFSGKKDKDLGPDQTDESTTLTQYESLHMGHFEKMMSEDRTKDSTGKIINSEVLVEIVKKLSFSLKNRQSS